MGEVIGYSILGIAAILIVAFSILSDKDEKERKKRMEKNGFVWKKRCCCPYCGSEDYASFQNQIYRGSNTNSTVKYSVHLNPFRPLIKRKESVVSRPKVTTETMYQCQSCGSSFRTPNGKWIHKKQ